MCNRAEPDNHKASVKEVVVDNSTINTSSNINKISVFGKGKYCFHGPKRSSSQNYYPNKKTVTLSIGSGQKEFLRVQRNQESFFYIHGTCTYEKSFLQLMLEF